MSVKRSEHIRGVQFDAETLRLVDDLCSRRGCSRSQLVRWLVRREAAADAQMVLPMDAPLREMEPEHTVKRSRRR
jgi:hypothetical protein